MVLVLTVADSFKNFSGGVQSSKGLSGVLWVMTKTKQTNLLRIKRGAATILLAVVAVSPAVAGSNPFSHAITMTRGTGAKKPSASEFGLGPRTSASGQYVATLTPERQLRPRQMQSIRVTVVDGNGNPIEGARLTIDGGMPEHGHGLPTRPRVTRSLGGGAYEIEGVRFNMGGWWEFKVAIESDLGADTITFNLGL